MPRPVKVKNKFLYHTSNPQNRKSIKNVGLMPGYGESSYFHHSEGEYVFLIPAKTVKQLFYTTYDDDVWQVSMEGLDQEFYIDDAMPETSKAVFTKVNIPASYLTLIHEGSGEDLIGEGDDGYYPGDNPGYDFWNDDSRKLISRLKEYIKYSS